MAQYTAMTDSGLTETPKRVHLLIGVGVRVLPGAKPVGWGDDKPFDDHPGNGYWTVTDVASTEDGNPFGSVEAAGWYWDPRDLSLN